MTKKSFRAQLKPLTKERAQFEGEVPFCDINPHADAAMTAFGLLNKLANISLSTSSSNLDLGIYFANIKTEI